MSNISVPFVWCLLCSFYSIFYFDFLNPDVCLLMTTFLFLLTQPEAKVQT